MSPPIISLDSSDDEEGAKSKLSPVNSSDVKNNGFQMPLNKRIKPEKIGDVATEASNSQSPFTNSFTQPLDRVSTSNSTSNTRTTNQSADQNVKNSSSAAPVENLSVVLTPELIEFIKACEQLNNSSDMKKILTRIKKIYSKVHESYVNTAQFKELVTTVTKRIRENPRLLFNEINEVCVELKLYRSYGRNLAEEEENPLPNPKVLEQIKKLHEGLNCCIAKISELENEEVDFDKELNSSYLVEHRYKKQALKIHKALCKLIGDDESMLWEPIKFRGTKFKEFNFKLQSIANRFNHFPDYSKVLRLLEACNLRYSYNLEKNEIQNIAQIAFRDLGEMLQKRRKTELYRTMLRFTKSGDPANSDPELQDKLTKNRKLGRKIDDLLDEYTQKQLKRKIDDPVKDEKNDDDPVASTSKDGCSPIKVKRENIIEISDEEDSS